MSNPKVKVAQRIVELGKIRLCDVTDKYDYIISGDLGCVILQERAKVERVEDEDNYEPMDDIEWREEMADRHEQAYRDSFSER